MSQIDHAVGVPISDPVYHFPWQVLEAIVSGRSAIDLKGLRIHTEREAADFMEAYGFHAADPEDQLELDEVYRLTSAFIREVLLPFGPLKELPAELPASYPEILLLASTGGHALKDWACSFLRVSHAVVHARYSRDMQVLLPARQQIFERFSAHLKVGQHGMVVTDGEMHIPLVRCDFKAEKPWESLVLKLLHKVDSVAQEVYDLLGVRFVTPDKAYALLLLKYFRANNVFAFANIKPSRSVNTLVDLKAFRAGFEELEEAYHLGELTFKEFTGGVHRLDARPEAEPGRNRFSASDYQTMQFTARALIRVPTPAGYQRTFVPFEVQIMDEEGYNANQEGEANHDAYRVRQREAVGRRVFPWADREGAAERLVPQR